MDDNGIQRVRVVLYKYNNWGGVQFIGNYGAQIPTPIPGLVSWSYSFENLESNARYKISVYGQDIAGNRSQDSAVLNEIKIE